MVMQQVINASRVRQDFSRYMDEIRTKPLFVRRNKRDVFAAISVEQLKHLLYKYQFTLEYETENGQYAGSLKEIDLVALGNSLDELKMELAKELVDYANDYFEYDFFKAANRRDHFPYVLYVLVQDDIEGVKNLIHA